MGIESYQDLRVWQEAMDLAEIAYRVTAKMLRPEHRGLANQIRRSAASVPANVAEGYGRDSTGSYIQFLKIARGSLKEFETHTLLAQRVGILDAAHAKQFLSKSERIGKMLNALIRSLRPRKQSQPDFA